MKEFWRKLSLRPSPLKSAFIDEAKSKSACLINDDNDEYDDTQSHNDASRELSTLRHDLLGNEKEQPCPTQAILAVVVLVLLIILLTTVVFVPVLLAYPDSQIGAMTYWSHSIYVASTTAAATAATVFVDGQIKQLWLSEMLHARILPVQRSIHLRKVRLLLGIGPVKNYLRLWYLALRVVTITLITTAVIAGITPSKNQSTTTNQAELSLGSQYPTTTSCMSVSDSAPTDNVFSWKLPNGSYYALSEYSLLQAGSCQVQSAINTVPLTMQQAPVSPCASSWAYSVQNTPVAPSALGVPSSLVDSAWMFGDHGLVLPSSLVSVESCSPILRSNPVKCYASGTVSVNGNTLTVEAEGCSITRNVYEVDPSVDPAGVAGACTAGLPLGRAVLVFGAVNAYAGILASTLNDTAAANATDAITAYSAVCHVDVVGSLIFQQTVLASVAEVSKLGPNLDGYGCGLLGDGTVSSVVYGTGIPCEAQAFPAQTSGNVSWFFGDMPRADLQRISVDEVLSSEALFVGAAASSMLLSEARGQDGWWPTLNAYAMPVTVSGDTSANVLVQQLNPRVYRNAQTFNYNDSTNGLEDALGTASAMALSSFYGGQSLSVGAFEADGSTFFLETSVTAWSTTVGPNSTWALVFLIPLLAALVLLCWLLALRWRRIRGETATRLFLRHIRRIGKILQTLLT